MEKMEGGEETERQGTGYCVGSGPLRSSLHDGMRCQRLLWGNTSTEQRVIGQADHGEFLGRGGGRKDGEEELPGCSTALRKHQAHWSAVSEQTLSLKDCCIRQEGARTSPPAWSLAGSSWEAALPGCRPVVDQISWVVCSKGSGATAPSHGRVSRRTSELRTPLATRHELHPTHNEWMVHGKH